MVLADSPLKTMSSYDEIRHEDVMDIPHCSYFDVNKNEWLEDGCYVLNFTSEFVECTCMHHTTFVPTLKSFSPRTNNINEDSWKVLSWSNVSENPVSLCTMLVVPHIFDGLQQTLRSDTKN